MNIPKTTIDNHIAKPLSNLLGLEISRIHSEYQERGSPGTVCKVSIFDKYQNESSFILKKESDDRTYRLYKQYLGPYNLNSPKVYGCIELDEQRFLVMDYINHLVPNWDDSNCYLEAVKWLIKKDLVTSQNLDSIRDFDSLEKMDFYGIDYWLPELEQWHKAAMHNTQAKAVWSKVNANQSRINEYIADIKQSGVQTVVHGDLQMDNILFGEDKYKNKIFVIDWTEPHVASVTKDLASLYDNAPKSVNSDLIKIYREQIDFPYFDEIFAKAKVLRDLGYLSWMAWMINEGHKEEYYQPDLDRVAKSLISSLS
jgi:aminoglycoside phosphotransferase (APT) family kinase protein